jgi:putative flippase GtrA
MQPSMISKLLPMIKFGSVGIINTLVDLAIFTLLTALGVTALPAQVVSYSGGVVNSYYMNTRWTFHKETRTPGQALRYVAVNLATLAITTVLLLILHTYTPFALLECKLIATVVSVGMNYMGSRYWAFGSDHRSTRNTLQE